MDDNAHKLAVITAMFRESDMFHTPKSREEATAWLENQCRGNPQAGIYFMVALNYAAEMIKQVMDGTHPGLTPTHDPNADVPIPAHNATPMKRFLTYCDNSGEIHVTETADDEDEDDWMDYIWQFAASPGLAIAQHHAKLDERADWINAGNPEKETY